MEVWVGIRSVARTCTSCEADESAARGRNADISIMVSNGSVEAAGGWWNGLLSLGDEDTVGFIGLEMQYKLMTMKEIGKAAQGAVATNLQPAP